jgi:hypothetical protein
MKLLNPTLGSDFEMLVRVIETGEIVPCPIEHGGTKEKPLSIGDCGYGECFRQIDGVAAEYNIPVVTTLEAWVTAYEYCKTKGNEILNPMGLELVAKTSHMFDKKQLTEERHKTFGCSESYCAYDWSLLEPNGADAGNMRSTGSHIHIGFEITEEFDGDFVQRLMFCMDKELGIPSLNIDSDVERRKLYGVAGDYRDKFLNEKGKTLERHEAEDAKIVILEYRSLGGALVDDPAFLFEGTQEAIKLFNSDYVFEEEEICKQRDLINHQVKVLEHVE